MNKKRLLAFSLTTMMGFNFLANGMAASASENKSEVPTEGEYFYDSEFDMMAPATFEDFLSCYELEPIPKDKLPVIKKAYENYKSEIDKKAGGDPESASQKLDSLLEPYIKEFNFEMNYPDFDEYIKSYGPMKEISKKDLTELEKFYNESVQLEKGNKYEKASEKWTAFDNIISKYYDGADALDFTVNFNEMYDLKDVPEKDKKELESLYNKAIKLQEEQKFEEADKVWESFDKIMNKYYQVESYAPATFDELIKDYGIDKITPADKKQAEELYNKALKLEKDNKFEEANKIWDSVYKIIDKYFTQVEYNMTMMPFDEFMKSYDFKDIPAKDRSEMEKLYKASVEQDKKGDYEASAKTWAEFDELFYKYCDEQGMNAESTATVENFDDYVKFLDIKNLTAKDKEELRKHYDTANKLASEGKLDESYEHWNAFSEILDKYYDTPERRAYIEKYYDMEKSSK